MDDLNVHMINDINKRKIVQSCFDIILSCIRVPNLPKANVNNVADI